MKNLTINGLGENVAYCEAKGLSKCFDFYAENCAHETITGIGFNENSGNIYIALENGITIASCVGQDLVFYKNGCSGEEFYFENYEDALNFNEEDH